MPGAGLQDDGRVVSVPSANFLLALDPRVWRRDRGVKLQPFGDVLRTETVPGVEFVGRSL